MGDNIYFEHIDFKNYASIQEDDYKFYFNVKQNSKKISIETGFIYQEYSGIEIKNKYQDDYETYSNLYDKISNIIVILDDKQEVCKNLKNKLTFYDDKLSISKKDILGKYDKFHFIQNSICLSKSLKEYCVFNLDVGWNYYLKKTGELLSIENSQIIKNKTIKFYSDNKDKSKAEKKELIKFLEFELEFIEGNKKTNKKVTMSEILNKKDRIDTEVYVRKSQSLTDTINIKKPDECNEDELLMFYGKPEKIEVRTLGKLMKIYKNNSYIKFHCDILNGYINKNVDSNEKKRKMGLQYIIRAIEIINDNMICDELETNNINNNKYNKSNKYYNMYNNINDDIDDNIKKKPVYLFGKKK